MILITWKLSLLPLLKETIILVKAFVQRLCQYFESWFHPWKHAIEEQEQSEKQKDRKSRVNYCNSDFFLLDENASFRREFEVKLWCCYQHHVVGKSMGNCFGSSQDPEAEHGQESWCITDTHTRPGTAVLVGRHDQDSSNSSSPANRSFGPDELPGHGCRQPGQQLCSTILSETQIFQQDWKAAEALPDPDGSGTVVPAALTHFSSSWEWCYGAGLIPRSLCTTALQHELGLVSFLCVYTQRCRGGCFVPVAIIYCQDPELNSLQRTKYLYLACTAIMILQPLTPCSCSHGGQLAYKFNEII